jgi:hypothetical protein
MNSVVWQVGDDWRPLSEELATADVVTVLSINGSCRLLDLAAGRQCRIPIAHRMMGDLTWQPLAGVIATPCGLITATGGPGGYHTTTRLRLVVAELEPDLAATPSGQAALAAPWTAPHHGPDPCSTPYCELAKDATSRSAEPTAVGLNGSVPTRRSCSTLPRPVPTGGGDDSRDRYGP